MPASDWQPDPAKGVFETLLVVDGETVELERHLARLLHLSDYYRAAVDALTLWLLNKLLHAPTTRLREAAGNGRGTGVLDTVRYLFELDQTAGTDDDG